MKEQRVMFFLKKKIVNLQKMALKFQFSKPENKIVFGQNCYPVTVDQNRNYNGILPIFLALANPDEGSTSRLL